jgi:hypothetical protein
MRRLEIQRMRRQMRILWKRRNMRGEDGKEKYERGRRDWKRKTYRKKRRNEGKGIEMEEKEAANRGYYGRVEEGKDKRRR